MLNESIVRRLTTGPGPPESVVTRAGFGRVARAVHESRDSWKKILPLAVL